MADFSDRVILVTGASGGLGPSVVQAFLDAGAAVAGVARKWGENPIPGTFIPLEADLTKPSECARTVEELIAAAGRIDVVIHVMGGFAGGQPVQQTGDSTWARMMDMNLNAAFYMFRAVLPHLVARGRGRIVAIGSRAGIENGPNLSAYNVSKAGLNALVRTAAAEVRDQGVTVNAILPSTIDTAANRAAMPDADFSRWVKPEAIAATLLWLASDAAADVNGALLPVYGRA